MILFVFDALLDGLLDLGLDGIYEERIAFAFLIVGHCIRG